MMANNEFMKIYNLGHINKPKIDLNSTKVTYNMDIAFEQMAKSFAEQNDEAIINYLYNKYRDSNVSHVYMLSKPDFERFLLEMLPKWIKGVK